MFCRLSETEGGGRDSSVFQLILESEDFKKSVLRLRKCVIESDARFGGLCDAKLGRLGCGTELIAN